MSLLHRLQRVYRTRLLGGAGRAAAAALLLVASLAAPGAAPILAAPAAVAPLAPQSGCGVVVNNSDNAPGSLRWTVGCVAAGATVTFDPLLAGQTIILTGTEIAINQPITIDGGAAPGIIVDAGNNSRIFNISASGAVTLTALTLQHGSVTNAAGGAVYDSSSSALVLNGVNVLSSTVTFGTGGGLYANGSLTLNNSDFISDTSTSNGGGVVAGGAAVVTGGRFERDTCTTGGCSGGAVFGFASLTLSGTQFISNTSLSQGGAAYTLANAVLTNGSFQGNKCTGGGCQGGGLYVNNSLTLTGTEFINNASLGYGGGVRSSGAARVTGAVFQDNRCTGGNCKGGGLSVDDAVIVTGTQFIHNTGFSYGSGAYVVGTSEVTNSLFQDNHCSESSCNGGGLLSDGAVTLTHVNFYSNTSQLGGGGLWAYQAATVTDSHFENNACARDGCIGGGLYGNAGVTLTSTQFISNTSGRGGGVWAEDATSIAGGRFERNTCTNAIYCFGGGLATYGALTITGAQFVNNASEGDGGALAAYNEVMITNTLFQDNACTVADCLGGALSINYTADVLNSAFSSNHSAGRGGAIGLTATAQIMMANVTLSGNMASVSGGGLYAGGTSTASLYNVTLADNQAPSGGGLAADIGATLGVTNTIIASNGASNCLGTIASGTHNLEFPGNTCAAAGPAAGFTTADPLLAPLALNPPGTTLTQALLPGSPARDHGDPVSCANSLVNNLDQRGAVRPDAGGEACDIGAYEAGAPDWLVFLPLVLK